MLNGGEGSEPCSKAYDRAGVDQKLTQKVLG